MKIYVLGQRNKIQTKNKIILVKFCGKVPGVIMVSNPICPGVNLDKKMLLIWNLAQSYFVMLQKKWLRKIFKIAATGTMTSRIMPFFFESHAKNCENMFFSKIKLVIARKKIFKIFFQLLKVKITYKLNIYRLIC